MITKEDFRELVNLKNRLFELSDGLEKLGISILESELFTIPGCAIDLVVTTNFTEKGADIVFWWLYEDRATVKIINSKETEHNIEDPDGFYDYLVENNYVISNN